MSAILLVRHGQASWGTDDYDRLSPRGHSQATWLGQSWEAAGFVPSHAVAGGMRRHAETATGALDVADPDSTGWDVDARWDEFDHRVFARGDDAVLNGDPRAFQAVLDEGLAAWELADGDDYPEPYAAFRDRVRGAFDDLAGSLGRGERAVVFTSGGPVAQVASWLLTGDDTIWRRMNRVVANASVTTVTIGRSGRTLLTFNEHTHLPADAVTFR
ncbi:histidine phosphatase family protein [Solicola sp. PLA-1-18]|uniref:histidine phosphatase family protein n=1 Tax=Solicola sp. PLA-1-18 TaxID=3380532 RepID=UPI003B7A6A1E